MYHFKTKNGFTLIELLVVMLLLSLSMSIILPLTVDNVEKSRISGEIQLIDLFIQEVRRDSFFLQQPIQVKFIGKQITALAKDYDKTLKTEHIAFDNVRVQFEPTGASPTEKVAAAVDSRRWELSFEEKKTVWNDPD
ncbi:prepilin-type N-terminal cleavage/methylation domain-containing protein [Shewanella mesophila]|uniref:prepilin-type N-terminal cleavage/methylation domain-containing protein n=1 Tax=Shewanella mesophila TaxID=2864208 RepID=UPI001C65EE9C|nr:prepilin-type N-terminal cleavage/methylation domain-containing protein [Shewanella mesophila]QYJ85005.1 prepilin-type N-terminal cleavage/methylation domain-containing protein [Shewanella mesophila]